MVHIFLFSWVLLLFCLRVDAQQPATFVSTTRETPWQQILPGISKAGDIVDVHISTKDRQQVIHGFGACFNELGWTSLNALGEGDKQAVLKELFLPGAGANFTICRMPVGANDFSRNWYSYNEVDGDFDMQHFSIGNDRETLIPFITNAIKYNPELRIWASPWSPPAWMKTNKHYACNTLPRSWDKKFDNGLKPEQRGREGSDMFRTEPAYYKAYARYFSLFTEAYKKEGISVSAVMPQNEFNSCQIFPSCTWNSSSLATFIGEYLGPEMKKQQVDVMFGTMERPNITMVDTVLQDPVAGQYIRGIGFQWAGKEAIPAVHRKYPGMTLYQSEQECGDGKNDWNYCRYAWTLMKHYLLNGTNAYMYWNISLEKGGFSRWGWQQNSLVTVDPEAKTYHYNHEYYLLKHVSHFVKPGAYRLQTRGTFDNLLAFINPDQSVVLVLQNETDRPKTIRLAIDSRELAIPLPADSFNTVVVK